MQQPSVIVVVLLTIIAGPMQSHHVESEICSPLHPRFPTVNINHNFFNLATWYIYAHSDLHPDHISIFRIPHDLMEVPNCLRVLSETMRGLIRLRFNCYSFTDLFKMTLYSTGPTRRRYRQYYRDKMMFKKYHPPGEVQVVASDLQRYVVFIGCQRVKKQAQTGLLFLVRAEVYDHFVPPAALIEKLEHHFTFNLTHRLTAAAEANVGHSCECEAAVIHRHRELKQILEQNSEKARINAWKRAQFAIGIRNFFVCVLSFALLLLIVAKLIDMYVFDIDYTMDHGWVSSWTP